MLRSLAVAAVLVSLSLAAPAGAQEETPTLESCARQYGSCVDACRARPQSDAAEAGCIARCATGRASCEAKAGYEQAQPWLKEQMDKLEDFLRGFRDGPGEPGYEDL